jgi:spermidine synthase
MGAAEWADHFKIHQEAPAFDPPPAVRNCYAYKGDSIGIEACVDMISPLRPPFEYIRTMFAASLIVARPLRILLLGLGAGSLLTIVNERHPNALIEIVESDKLVFDMAKAVLGLRLPASSTLSFADGALFTHRCAASRECGYDLIFVDVFNAVTIPPQFLSQTFAVSLSQSLARGGAAVLNIDDVNAAFMLETCLSSFAAVWQFPLDEDSENIVFVAYKPDDAPVRTEDWIRIAQEQQLDWPHFELLPRVEKVTNSSTAAVVAAANADVVFT